MFLALEDMNTGCKMSIQTSRMRSELRYLVCIAKFGRVVPTVNRYEINGHRGFSDNISK